MRFCSRCSVGLGLGWLLLSVSCGGPSLDPFAPGAALGGGAGANSTLTAAVGGGGTTGAVSGSDDAGRPGSGAVGGSSDGGAPSGSAGTPAEQAGSAPMPWGGESGNGAGGAGGTGVVVDPDSACFGHTLVPPVLLADAEAGLKGFFAYVGSSSAPLSLVHPGAANTSAAIDFHGGKADSSGMGVGMFCDDVSSFAGVSFWAKGRGGEHLRFLVAIPATDATKGRGDCDPAQVKCNDHPGKALVLSNEWKQYTVAWNELQQYGWGEPATFGGIANSLLWINDGPVDSFDFVVDEVTLVSAQ